MIFFRTLSLRIFAGAGAVWLGLALPGPAQNLTLPATPTMPPPSQQMVLPGAPPPPGATTGSPGSGPDIHDIHGPELLTFWEQHGTQASLGAGAGVLVLALVIWLICRRKPKPPLTAIELARQELGLARSLMGVAEDKDFASAVSDAVRHYLENAYRMPAPERTTEEFLQEAARQAWLQGELAEQLRFFLELCDLAKFAGQEFGDEERGRLAATGSEFVELAEKLRAAPAPGANPAGSNWKPAVS